MPFPGGVEPGTRRVKAGVLFLERFMFSGAVSGTGRLKGEGER